MPSFKSAILFLEMAEKVSLADFDRRLQSLIHQPDFNGIQGIVVGRFQQGQPFDNGDLKQVLRSKPELQGLPIVIGADFGHTTPTFTYPIGGRVCLKAATGDAPQLLIH